MERFSQKTALPTPQGAAYSLEKAFETKRRRWTILKSHRCASLEEANQLLKSALYLQKRGKVAFLLSPFFSGDFAAITLTFVFAFVDDYQRLLELKWNRDWPCGQKGYKQKEVLHANSPVQVFRGFHASLPLLPLVIKTYRFDKLTKANSALKEGFAQSRLDHPNVCRLLDMSVTQFKTRGIEVLLALEGQAEDLLSQIRKKAEGGQPYSERELRRILKQAGRGLLHAKEHVLFTQNIAHRDIKPANMLTDGFGHVKVCDFGSVWEKPDETLTTNAEGTDAYLSPEAVPVKKGVKGKNYDPFKSDVYSLGLTTLHLASLEPPSKRVPVEDRVEKLSYSSSFKTLFLSMLQQAPERRATLNDVLSQKVPHSSFEEMMQRFAVVSPSQQQVVKALWESQERIASFCDELCAMVESAAQLRDQWLQYARTETERMETAVAAALREMADSTAPSRLGEWLEQGLLPPFIECTVSQPDWDNVVQLWTNWEHSLSYHNPEDPEATKVKLREIGTIYQCRRDVSARYEDVIRSVHLSKNQLLDQLKEWKEAAIMRDISSEQSVFTYEIKTSDKRLRDPLEICVHSAVPCILTFESGGAQIVRELHELQAKLLSESEKCAQFQAEVQTLTQERAELQKEVAEATSNQLQREIESARNASDFLKVLALTQQALDSNQPIFSNVQSETYVQMGNWQEAVRVSQSTLRSRQSGGDAAEVLRGFFWCVTSLYELGQVTDGDSVSVEANAVVAETGSCKALLCLINAQKAKYHDDKDEAVQLYEQGLGSNEVSGLIEAECRQNLGTLYGMTAYRKHSAKQELETALQLYAKCGFGTRSVSCLLLTAILSTDAEGEPLYRRALEITAALPRSLDLAEILLHYGRQYDMKERATEGKKLHRRALKIAAALPLSNVYVQCLLRSGQQYYWLNRPREGEQLYRRALEAAALPPSTVYVQCLLQYAQQCYWTMRTTEGEQLYQRAMEIAAGLPPSTVYVQCLLEYGQQCYWNMRAAERGQLYQRALETAADLSPSLDLARKLLEYGQQCYWQERATECEQLFRQAVEIAPPSTVYVQCLLQYAQQCFKDNRATEGEQLYRRAVESAASLRPSLDLARKLLEYEQCYWQERAVEGEQLFRRALQIAAALPPSLDLAKTLLHYGQECYWKQRAAEGGQLYWRAVEVAVASPPCLDLAETLLHHGRQYYRQERATEGEQLYRRALRTAAALPPSTVYVQCLLQYAQQCFKDKRAAVGEQLNRRAMKIAAATPPSLDLARKLLEYGQKCYWQERAAEREQLFQQAVETAAALPPSTVYVQCLLQYAQQCFKDNRATEGEQLYRQALEIAAALPPCLDLAKTLLHYGQQYYRKERATEGEQLYRQALETAAALPPSLALTCLKKIDLRGLSEPARIMAVAELRKLRSAVGNDAVLAEIDELIDS